MKQSILLRSLVEARTLLLSLKGLKPRLMERRLFFLLFLNNLLYLVALASLIVLLVLGGTAGPNRFGPEPAR